MRIKFLFFSFCIFLTACGTNSTQNSAAQEIDDRSQLLSSYRAVAGVYRGLLSPEADGQPSYGIELKIFIVEEANGTNEAGEARFRPTLRAFYRQLNDSTEIASRALVVRYYRESSEIVMGSASGNSGLPADAVAFLSITGKFLGERLVGEVSNHRGRLGIIELERTPD